MDSFLYSINATVPIFLVMIVGWVIKQLGVIDDHFANVANKYVFKVALPVLLFRDLAAADFKSQFDVKFVLYCMIVTTIMFSGIWICTEIFMKDDTQKGAFVQASFRSSAAILGMAFIQNMYQSTGMAPLMIVAAVPFAKMINSDYVKEGAVVLDVGINRDENNKLCGDVDFEDVKDKVYAITPVPGGIGPMTITMLLQNTLEAFYHHQGE